MMSGLVSRTSSNGSHSAARKPSHVPGFLLCRSVAKLLGEDALVPRMTGVEEQRSGPGLRFL